MSVQINGEDLGVHTNLEDASRKPTKTDSFWHIDKEMLRFKIHFFLYLGALAAAIPFIVVFAKERVGIAASSLGAVLTTQMFLFIFTKPLIGYIADYFNKLKAIICVLTVLNGLCYFLLLIIPKQNHGVFMNSSTNFKDVLFNKCDVDQNFTQNETNFSLLNISDMNFTDDQSKNKAWSLCCIYNNRFRDVLDKSIPGNKSSGNRLHDCVNITKKNEQAFLQCFNQSNFSNLSNCDDCSALGNFSRDCVELIRSNSFECNIRDETSKSKFPLVILSSQNLNKILLSCNGYNASENHPVVFKHRTVSDFQTIQFWAFAILFSTSSICANAIFTLSDTACCESIQKTGADFGKQRVWGSIGWGVLAPIGGLINDYTQDFLESWILMAVMLLVFLWNISKLDLVKPHFSQNILRDVGTVLKSKEFLIFEVVILLNGMGAGMIWFYLMWFLKSIGGSDFLCGLSIAVQCFGGALPFMFFSGWIIQKFGHYQVLCASLLAYVIRFLWYSYLQNPWWVLPVEILHGITYGLYYTVIASYGKLSAKPGTEATTQSILFSTHEGLGEGIGCIIAGISFDYYGGHQTFFISAIFCACGFIASICLSFVIRNQKRMLYVTESQLQDRT
ncbi:Major facilitator superfamily domain-containing protein 6 [Araneus ventricosus]|uniref:Major facilitator superfamily domain-containing protein 6 n=1 Tax=Araneus ventricosus TaxID=182803 RepID=A0A4Y2EMQ4_ARAVE|nr:Major facilitator superfamily domain-containing protein 6 [Araneus ventricosus]